MNYKILQNQLNFTYFISVRKYRKKARWVSPGFSDPRGFPSEVVQKPLKHQRGGTIARPNKGFQHQSREDAVRIEKDD
jgi:hypothetical protein